MLQIARDVLIEARRNHFFWLSLGISILVLFVTASFTSTDEAMRGKLFLESGISLLWLVHLLLAVFFTTDSLYNDLERKSIYYYLVREVSRLEYLFGKYLGVVVAVGLSLLITGLVFTLCATYLAGFQIRYLIGLAFIFLELSLAIAILILFSTLFTKLITIFAFFFLFFFVSLLEHYLLGSDGNQLIKVFLLIIPNFKYYGYLNMVVHAREFSLKYMGFLGIYTFFFSISSLFLASLQFDRKAV